MSRGDAIKVLKEVQNARRTLEQNISEVCRKHEQVDLFNYFDTGLRPPRCGEEENIIRIKKQVNDKIKEITNEIQTEIYTKKPCNSKGTKGYTDRKSGRLALTQINKKSAVLKPPTNINTRLPIKAKVKKGKTKKSEPPPKSSTAYDELILQHIYGRQPHQPHRHTYRNEKPGFCTPKHVSNTVPSPYPATFAETKEIPKDLHQIQPKNEYCIHLQPQNNMPFSIGHNFPTAISLVEPSRCLSERLPLSISPNELAETKSPKVVTKKHKLAKAGPNVAVINIKADDMAENSAMKNRIKSKVRDRLKNRMKLNIQPLPNVDIDTTDTSTSTMSYASQLSRNAERTIEDTANVSEINENPYDFQDYISVHNLPKKSTNDTDDEVQHDESSKQPQISLPGCKEPQEQQVYHGPVFPPQFHKGYDVIDTGPVEMVPTLEQSAHDWLEKELLARLITQIMDQQNQLPLTEYADNVSVVSVESDESKSSHDWIDNIIGLRGIQLFIDAGLPVNKDLITELIRTVISECLETLFGHPKPEEAIEYPPVDLCVQSVVPTPLTTPMTTPCASEMKDNETPNQTISDLTEQNIDDMVTEASVHGENNDECHYETVETPNVSILENNNVLKNNIVTPDITLIEDADASANEFRTPANSDKTLELTQFPISDFEVTYQMVSPHSSLGDLEITTPPILVVAKAFSVTTTPSIPSTVLTISSSTAIGLSTFDEISMGEYLNADSVVSDGSEGELGLVGRLKIIDETIEVVDDSFSGMTKSVSQKHLFPSKQHPRSFDKVNTNNDIQSEGEVCQPFWRPLKSIGEVSDVTKSDQSLDTDHLGDDTDELSITKALNEEDDPMIRLLHKINSPPLDSNLSYPGHSYKSVGEVIPQKINTHSVKQIHSLSSGENISKESLTLGMLNQESDLVSSIQDDSNLTPVSGTKRHVINVQPISHRGNENTEILRSDGEILNNEDVQLEEISKSEGELHIEKVLSCELRDHQNSLTEEEVDDNEKVVMVLRLPEVEDDQNVTDYDLSLDDISTISEL